MARQTQDLLPISIGIEAAGKRKDRPIRCPSSRCDGARRQHGHLSVAPKFARCHFKTPSKHTGHM